MSRGRRHLSALQGAEAAAAFEVVLYDLGYIQSAVSGDSPRERHDSDRNRIGDPGGDLDPQLRPGREHGTDSQYGGGKIGSWFV